jgi:tRNA (guanine-N7-)-methyltransferase
VENPLPPANLRLFTDDARPLIRSLADAALSKLFLMFPDPWPKARHAKRRFVHPMMLPEVARVLVPGGEWRIASDDATYQNWTDEVLAAQTLFTVTRVEATRPNGWPPTRYEAKAIAAGRTPIYWSLTKI